MFNRANLIYFEETGKKCLWTHKRYQIKVRQSHYRPGEALRVPGGWGSQISRQSALEGGNVVCHTHRPPLSQEILLVLICVRGWVDPKAIVQPEGLCQWKIPMTPTGIEPVTFQIVAQCLKQLRHCVPQTASNTSHKNQSDLHKFSANNTLHNDTVGVCSVRGKYWPPIAEIVNYKKITEFPSFWLKN